MILSSPGRPHLTYCTNIHPGETWPEVRRNIERYVVAVKAQVSPNQPFGVGLRLSAEAADALAKPDTLQEFRRFLHAGGLYVFTINGFPYGAFHGRRVKENVYRPDWLDERRLEYTDRLAELLAALLPNEEGVADLEGSISTVPGAFKPRVADETALARMVDVLIRHVATLHRVYEDSGRTISLALEPEPCCHLETVAETIAFFQRRLFSRSATARFSHLTGLSRGEAEERLRRHAGVCFDACHMAVEFEEPEEAVRAYQKAGIRISKMQLSAGLQAVFTGDDHEKLAALQALDDAVYLHQVVARRDGVLVRHADLPQAIHAVRAGDLGTHEWRIHVHVPLFRAQAGLLSTTQDYLRRLLALLRTECHAPHLEIETYTWSVLPEEYRQEDIVTAIVREMKWVIQRMTVSEEG